MQKPILIYDGDCSFCSSSVRTLQKFVKRVPPCEPYQFLKLEEYGLDVETCSKAIQYVSPSGRIFVGHLGFFALLRDAGGLWVIPGLVLNIWPISWVAGKVYYWIAANRSKMPGGTATCALPPAQRQAASGE